MHPDVARDMEVLRELYCLCAHHHDTQKGVLDAMLKAMPIVMGENNELHFSWWDLAMEVMHQELGVS